MKSAEEYWNNKHNKIEQTYEGRYIPKFDKIIATDVRRFIWNDDILLQNAIELEIFGTPIPLLDHSMDKVAHMIQHWVCLGRRKLGARKNSNVLRYVYDNASQGYTEFWQFTNETLALGTGDCEDGAILIASLLLNAGIPPWRVRVAAGWVKPSPTAPQGGHGYCCYCRELDNRWVVLDWCFYEDPKIPVIDKKLIRDRPEYKDVWFSFNNLYAWSHTQFHMEGRVKDHDEKPVDV